jgi:hypothetical protein
VPGGNRAQRIANASLQGSSGNAPALALAPGSIQNGLAASGSKAGIATSAPPAEHGWDQGGDRKAPSRTGFKISHLEDIFASNQFLNNVHSIAKDQAGCRMLQHKLDEGNPEVTNAIFLEVLMHATELMMDPFGNYLCQKLMDLCNHRQLELILDHVCMDLVRISLNMHGARAVQKLIDAVAATPLVGRLVKALEGAVVSLTQDPNGNHVIQRCLEVLPPETRHFVFRAVAEEIVAVASHRHGCRIVQRCIDAATGADRYLLEGSICTNSLMLVQDAFGNYVVQYVLGLNNPTAISCIIHAIGGRLNVLSRQKFSSNVVECCLQIACPEDKDKMLMEIAEPRTLSELLRDVYGNYVVQSALGIANERQLAIMLSMLRPVLPSLRASGQGRRIAQKLEKKYPQLRTGAEAVASGGGGAAASSEPRGGGNSAPATSQTPGLAGPPLRLDDALTGVGALGSPGMPVAPGMQVAPGIAGMSAGMGIPGSLPHGGLHGGLQPGGTLATGNGALQNAPLQGANVGAADAAAGGGRGGARQKKGRRKEPSGGNPGAGVGKH